MGTSFWVAARRNALQQAWLDWLTVSYGSVAAADKRFHGVHALPTDAELCNETPDVRVSAYKRFLDDFLSRNYRNVRAAITSVDSTHLIGARSGYGGNGSRPACGLALVDLRAGAKHLDFISPEGYALDATDKDSLLSRGGFTTAYADIGKPILWAEFGINVDRSCPNCTEEVQASYFANIWELVRRSHANGAAAWWFVGVRPQATTDGEKSDYGILYDYMKFPTSVDGDGRHARIGSLALCTSDPNQRSITRWKASGGTEMSSCPRGTSSRGRFRSEAPLTGAEASGLRRGTRPRSGWQDLCSSDDSELLVTTVDEGTREQFKCPNGYSAAGAFKPADSDDTNPVVAVDGKGRSVKAGWLTLCTRNHSGKLELTYNEMSERKRVCPSGSVSAGIFTPKTAPVFRPAAQQIAGVLSAETPVDRHYASWISVDRDKSAGDWKMYEEGTREFAIASTKSPSVGVRTVCFGSSSRAERSCVGDQPFGSSCPAKCLNAEWNAIEILNSDARWERVQDGSTVTVSQATPVHARFSAGNVGESTWVPGAELGKAAGAVRFACNENAGELSCRADINAEVPGGSDAVSGDVLISAPITKTTWIAFQMVAEGVAWFGERINVKLTPK